MAQPHHSMQATRWQLPLGLLFLVAATTCFRTAQCHGYLAHPPARQVIKGLGVTPIENGNALGLGLPANYSSMAAGVCGDPFEGAFNGLYPVSSAPFDPVWAVRVMDGDTIDITLTLAANHTGVHSFHIMPVTSESLPPRALLTQGVGSPSSLLATGHPPGPTNPLHGDAQWWIRSSGAPGSLWQNYTAQFKLPAGLVGEDNVPVRAVLRWQWVVRKDCDLLCGWLPANSSAPCGPYPLITPQNCASQPDPLYVFSNCADILITGLPDAQNNGGVTPYDDPYAPTAPAPPNQPPPPPWPTASYTPGSQPPAPGSECLADVDAFCAAKGLGSGLFPDPCACDRFIVCESGFTGAFGDVRQCPDGATFNVDTLQCDTEGRCGSGMNRRSLEALNLWTF